LPRRAAAQKGLDKIVMPLLNPVGVLEFLSFGSHGSRCARQPWATLSNPFGIFTTGSILFWKLDRLHKACLTLVAACGMFLAMEHRPAYCDSPARRIRVVLPADADPVIAHAAKVLARQIQQRCDASGVASGDADLTVELAVQAGIGAEGFSIEAAKGSPSAVRIVGNDPRGVVYGIGKFLRTSRYDRGGFTPGAWRGASKPQKPIRGIYFATHFHNFYHDAPIEEIERYVEDLALWGFNTVTVWYDMHHFNGFDDPEAVAFRQRLHAILSAAKEIGLDVGFGVVANEAYNDSPVALRADRSAQRGGWYDCQVCPSKPEGRAYILGVLGQLFDWYADLRPRFVWIWPYDQGGCGCSECRPWGNNGFLKIGEPVAALARQKLSGAKIILSTWMFDEAEWQGLTKAFTEKSPWADLILAEGTTRAMPGELPMIGFPEISMFNMFPWGGFGATPLPNHYQAEWNAVKQHTSGGFPYSEGIYEDLNKVLFSQFYWGDQPAETTLREYIAFEYSLDVVEDVLKVIATLEQNHHMRWWPSELEGVKLQLDWFPSHGVKPQADPGAEEAYETVLRVDAKLMPQARQAWRWRQLYLRALLDAELKKNGGSPNDACRAAFAELIKMYHAENADPVVRSPSP